MQGFSRFILKIFGWKITGRVPEGTDKFVMVIAPHTSNWDFIIGRFGFWVMGVRVRFLIKKEAFKWPMSVLIKLAGGLPVDREQGKNITNYSIHLFEKYPSLCIAVTPEGTRRRVNHWKKGFYFIAHKAKVPLVFSYIDYKKKEGGIGPVIYPTGSYKDDMKAIYDFYKDVRACHPDRFNIDAILSSKQ